MGLKSSDLLHNYDRKSTSNNINTVNSTDSYREIEKLQIEQLLLKRTNFQAIHVQSLNEGGRRYKSVA